MAKKNERKEKVNELFTMLPAEIEFTPAQQAYVKDLYLRDPGQFTVNLQREFADPNRATWGSDMKFSDPAFRSTVDKHINRAISGLKEGEENLAERQARERTYGVVAGGEGFRPDVTGHGPVGTPVTQRFEFQRLIEPRGTLLKHAEPQYFNEHHVRPVWNDERLVVVPPNMPSYAGAGVGGGSAAPSQSQYLRGK